MFYIQVKNTEWCSPTTAQCNQKEILVLNVNCGALVKPVFVEPYIVMHRESSPPSVSVVQCLTLISD